MLEQAALTLAKRTLPRTSVVENWLRVHWSGSARICWRWATEPMTSPSWSAFCPPWNRKQGSGAPGHRDGYAAPQYQDGRTEKAASGLPFQSVGIYPSQGAMACGGGFKNAVTYSGSHAVW